MDLEALARAVIRQAFIEARQGRKGARAWLLRQPNRDFTFWCACAGVDEAYARAAIRRALVGHAENARAA